MSEEQPLFVASGRDLRDKDDESLKRFATLAKDQLRSRWDSEGGRAILEAWQASGYDRAILDSLVGKIYGHTDLRGAPLRGARFSGEGLSAGAKLNDIDFFGADLRGADFSRANLKRSWLSETLIQGARFDFAKMDGVLIDNVKFDAKTSFYGVNLNAINFNLAALLQDAAYSQQRIADLEANHKLLAAVLKWTCDYGRSFGRFFLWAAGVIVIFASAYSLIPGATTAEGFGNHLYFSVVTFTTLGYGDIVPASTLGRVLVCIEVLIGYLMLGLLVGVLSKRVIRG